MFLIKTFFRLFFLLLLVVIVLPFALLFAGIQAEPLVGPGASLSQADVARLRVLVAEHDPRDMRDGETRQLPVTERDLALALNSVLPPVPAQRVAVELSPGVGFIRYSAALPPNPLGSYFNLSAVVTEKGNRVALDEISAGDMTLPGWLIAPLIALADGALRKRFPEYPAALSALEELRISQGVATATYRWHSSLGDQLEARGRDFLLPAEDRERIAAYYHEMSRLLSNPLTRHSMAGVLQPLAKLAVARTAQSGDAAAENRALFITLGAVMRGTGFSRLLGSHASSQSAQRPVAKVSLQGRGDLSRHFGISAALAVGGNSAFADAVGVFKELQDSQGGSGFSFPDLLADRSGVVLAATAIGPRASEIQRNLAAPNLQETDFMPPIDQLPEGLMEMEFNDRYRNLDDAAYAEVKREIEQRIENRPVYR
jgi:hypothetical protein